MNFNIQQWEKMRAGDQLAGENITVTVPHGSSVTYTQRASAAFDIFIRQIGVTLYVSNALVLETTAKDKITLQITDKENQQIFFNNGTADLWALKSLSLENNFPGFIIRQNSYLEYTFTHTENAWTSDFSLNILLLGTRYSNN